MPFVARLALLLRPDELGHVAEARDVIVVPVSSIARVGDGIRPTQNSTPGRAQCVRFGVLIAAKTAKVRVTMSSRR
jgi:hypothetical protein